ncbi:uncharacterized protein BDR25DRAFT_294330 [Lindgomyces ingoldianus]|uniref:Uncharacterized protein n=1 Tax=Lindgomyces ingoldianus TaxID=673940 RepID=A0ACB6QHY4_9PLEO|nr:uncharacterized protein BDR25DRAFT_294330 [Lindgomyces ingoldianus]KAF2466193.1 hypothetical protein BDR25DRAFT_294330 [Lindgomyces ingoldianus]
MSPASAFTNGFSSNESSTVMNGTIAHLSLLNGVNGNGGLINDSSSTLLEARVEQVVRHDIEKTELLRELLLRYQFLSEQYKTELEQNARERQSYREFHHKFEQLKQHNQALSHCVDRDPFVLVLIDGDGMIFLDEFIRAGEAGGRQAAAKLYSSITQYVQRELQNVPTEFRVVCRIYANVSGLAEVLVRCGVIEEVSPYHSFALGFTRGKTLFDFVDVGPGKDRADEKLIGTFKLYVNDFHCRHIFFGCSHDNGYARVLEDLCTEEHYLEKITLMEGVPFEKELLMLPFKTKKFPGIFRDFKLQLWGALPTMAPGTNGYPPTSAKVYPAFAGLPSRFPAPIRQSSAPQTPTMGRIAPSLQHTPSSSTLGENDAGIESKNIPVMNWAAKAAAPPPPTAESPVYKPTNREEVIARNRSGQRVDPPCRDYDKAEVDRVKKIKLCNVHFLRRECPYGTNCTHKHDYCPSNAEIAVLRLVARMAPCINGSACQDVKCIYGHRCPAPEAKNPVKGAKTCIFGSECKFPVELHNLDCNVVKTLVIR